MVLTVPACKAKPIARGARHLACGFDRRGIIVNLTQIQLTHLHQTEHQVGLQWRPYRLGEVYPALGHSYHH